MFRKYDINGTKLTVEFEKDCRLCDTPGALSSIPWQDLSPADVPCEDTELELVSPSVDEASATGWLSRVRDGDADTCSNGSEIRYCKVHAPTKHVQK